MTALQLCEKAIDQIIVRIPQDQEAKGIRTTGQSANSLRKQMHADGGDVLGSEYIYFQIHGRRPGKQPPLMPIIEWIESKGLELVDITVKGLAFVIARKIAKVGTDIWRGIREGLDLHTIVKEEVATVGKDIGKNAVEELLAAFRSLNNTGSTNN